MRCSLLANVVFTCLLALTAARADRAVSVRGALRDARGQFIPRVSRLALYPVQFADRTPASKERVAYPAQQTGDGHFTATLPEPGLYRALVDLDDSSVMPAAGMLLTMHAGENTPTITLPAPLLTVPAATEVCYLFRTAPLRVHTFVTPAGTHSLPLYGPASETIALWFHEGDEMLIVREQLPGKHATIRKLHHRQISLTILGAHGQPYPEFLTLAPLFPMSGAERDTLLLPGETDTSATATSLNRNRATRMLLWPGRYAVLDRARPAHLLVLVEIPEQGPEDVRVPVMNAPRLPSDVPLRKIELQIPSLPYGQRIGAAAYARITADTPTRYARYVSMDANGETIMPEIDVPASAHALTLYWPGVGMIRDAPLPPGPAPLPAWQPAVSISGTVRTQDGQPVANTTLHLGASAGPNLETVRVRTDATGHFAASGLQPGLLHIALDGAVGGWLRRIPPPDGTPLALQLPTKEISLAFQHEGVSFRQYWWVPVPGAPRRVFGFDGNGCRDLDLQPGQGWFWALDQVSGAAACARVSTSAENPRLLLAPPCPGPSLGLSMPLEPACGLPGAIILDGLEELAGIHVEYPTGCWQLCPELGQVFGQIEALPPGSYRVTVETATGNAVGQVMVSDYGGVIALPYPKGHK